MNIILKKGLDLPIAGGIPPEAAVQSVKPGLCAIFPDDYPGLTPKMALKEGDAVGVGTPVVYDKNNPDLKLVSPIEGTVKAVVRGERRKIIRVEIEAGKGLENVTFKFDAANPDSFRSALAQSGLMALIRRRPYDIVPGLQDHVRDIFVSAFDSAPLAGGLFRLPSNAYELMEKAVEALSRITDGKIYISYPAGQNFKAVKGAQMVEIAGPHPAGNVGTQIANVKPINKGETVWTMSSVTLCKIGALISAGRVDSEYTVAITGPELKTPGLVQTIAGASVEPLIKGRMADDSRHKRIISGNVLSGVSVGADGFLRFPFNQITVIAEGDDVDEFMGWASMATDKMSTSRSFPGHFLKRLFRPDARLNGGRRAMILSGIYDSMMPMDIMPEYLIKAILAKDIEQMEALGIYEIAPEDFALAEYADASKMPLQQIVRDGLDYIRKELE